MSQTFLKMMGLLGMFIPGLAALLTIGAIVCNPTVNAALTEGVKQAINSAEEGISRAKEKIRERRKAKDSDPRVHHMVAKAARRAEPARIILEDVGIDPRTAPENLITISHGLHKSMHTKKYYNYVNDKLLPCAGDRAAVEAALLEIRADIEFAEATGIKRWDIE